MRFVRPFLAAGLMSLVAVAVFAASSYAQQAPGVSTSAQFLAQELKDKVVSPDAFASSMPATTVHWRGRHGYRPYWRPYASRPYYGYPGPRCWWSGYRWICRPKRVIIY